MKSSTISRCDCALAISITSLVVTLLTFLLNVVLVHDVLRVVVGNSPTVQWQDDGIQVYGKQILTFINSGSRAAAVTSVTVAARRLVTDRPNDDTCADSATQLIFANISFDIEPFTVKPGKSKLSEEKLYPTACSSGAMQRGSFTLAINSIDSNRKRGFALFAIECGYAG